MKNYYLDVKTGEVMDSEEIEARFGKLPWEIADEYGDCPCEWVERGVRSGELVELSKENGFAWCEPLLPSEFARRAEVEEVITDDIGIEAFDMIVADGYNLWNYPLSEFFDLQAKGTIMVLVSFKEGYRLVEAVNNITFLEVV